jgi:uncharacterized protein involved in type VI secretion and phage assembly
MGQIEGVVVGLVTKLNEKTPGELKVRFTTLEASHETDWIRPVNALAGDNCGTFFMPRVNDEVLLAFERGNARFPYVLGYLWNGQDKPPADHVRIRRIQSVNGHRITFYDSTPSGGSKGALVIEDAHGNTISMSNTQIVIQAVGTLQLNAPNVLINGRVVAPTPNPI